MRSFEILYIFETCPISKYLSVNHHLHFKSLKYLLVLDEFFHLFLWVTEMILKYLNIVKLRRGSGKDQQGMAPKAKGLKA